MPKGVDRAVVRAVEKRARETDAFGVIVGAARGDARTEAFFYLVADAAGRSWLKLEELLLIAEVHSPIEGTVAQAEHVVQLADRLVDAERALKGPVIDGGVVVTSAADDEELRRRATRELDECEMTRIALHRDVEAGTILLDQPQLLQE